VSRLFIEKPAGFVRAAGRTEYLKPPKPAIGRAYSESLAAGFKMVKPGPLGTLEQPDHHISAKADVTRDFTIRLLLYAACMPR